MRKHTLLSLLFLWGIMPHLSQSGKSAAPSPLIAHRSSLHKSRRRRHFRVPAPVRPVFFSDRKQEAFAVLGEAQKKMPNDLGYSALHATLLYYDQPQAAKVLVDELAKVEPLANAYWECLESMRKNSFEYADACWQTLSTWPSAMWLEMTKYKYLQMKVRQGEKDRAIQLLSEILEKTCLLSTA